MKHSARIHLASPALAVLVAATPVWSATDTDAILSGRSVRSAALGRTDIAAEPDAATVFANPATSALLPASGLAFGHRVIAPGVSLQNGVFTVHPGGTAWGVAVRADVLLHDGVPASDALATGRANEAGWRAGVATAVELRPGLAAGLGLGRYSTLPVVAAPERGWALDSGLTWEHGPTRIAGALRGWTVAARPAAQAASRAWSVGTARRFTALGSEIFVQADGDAGRSPYPAAGVAYVVGRAIELRAGTRREVHVESYSAGAGVETGPVRIDYAANWGAGLRVEHGLGIVLALGTPGSGRRLASGAVAKRSPEDAAPQVPGRVAEQPAQPRVQAPPTPAAAPGPGRTPMRLDDPTTSNTTLFLVRAGPYPTLEAAARDVFRLNGADMHPEIERQGEQHLIVVHRSALRAEAEQWRARAERAGVHCRIDSE
jgi:hypothetical protein